VSGCSQVVYGGDLGEFARRLAPPDSPGSSPDGLDRVSEADHLGLGIPSEVRHALPDTSWSSLVQATILFRAGRPPGWGGCHDRAVNDTFARLASDNDLEDQVGLSPEGLTERYLYSSDMVFRYAFGRWWGSTDLATTAVWVLLNPATGDTEQRHRPTLERCISRSRAAGHTGLVIVNLFAFRDTNPRNLRNARDAVGPFNDEVLRLITTAGAQTIAAWGGHGRLGGRSGQVGPLLDSPMCLGMTQRGEPRHPLYVAGETPLVPWVPLRPAPDPENEKLRTVLLQATPGARKRLRAALGVVKSLTAECRHGVAWSPVTGEGSSADPLALSFPEYDAAFEELVEALLAAGAQPVFDWMNWDGCRLYPGGGGLAGAPVADAMRLITVIIRGERFCDGSIAKAIEDGSLVAATERIIAALDEPEVRP